MSCRVIHRPCDTVSQWRIAVDLTGLTGMARTPFMIHSHGTFVSSRIAYSGNQTQKVEPSLADVATTTSWLSPGETLKSFHRPLLHSMCCIPKGPRAPVSGYAGMN